MLKYFSIYSKWIVILTSFQFITAYLILEKLHNEVGKNVKDNFGNTTMLIVAHPDDETMFFGPTIESIINNDKRLIILCLSNGSKSNLEGEKRSKELLNVVNTLGPNVKLNIIDDEKLKDSMTSEWDDRIIMNYIEKEILEKNSNHQSINTIVTFDSYGISGHINHRSIYNAIKKMKNRLTELKVENTFILLSHSIVRKYISFLDSIPTYLMINMTEGNYLNIDERGKQFTLALNFEKYFHLREMLQFHNSQMVWFRKLYMIFSRYMFLNDLIPLI